MANDDTHQVDTGIESTSHQLSRVSSSGQNSHVLNDNDSQLSFRGVSTSRTISPEPYSPQDPPLREATDKEEEDSEEAESPRLMSQMLSSSHNSAQLERKFSSDSDESNLSGATPLSLPSDTNRIKTRPMTLNGMSPATRGATTLQELETIIDIPSVTSTLPDIPPPPVRYSNLFCRELRPYWWKVTKNFLFTNILIGCFCISMLSIFWGANYRRSYYTFKINILCVIQDESILTEQLPTLIHHSSNCRWHIYNTTAFIEKFHLKHDEKIDKRVWDLVHGEKYWMSLNIKEGVTDALYQSLTNPFAPPFNSTHFFEVMYESSRDPTNLKASVLPKMQYVVGIYQQYYTSQILPEFIRNITRTTGQTVFDPRKMAGAGNINFEYRDNRPFTDYVLLGPLQVGLIYGLLLTAFQYSLYASMHDKMIKILSLKAMVFYRLIISWGTIFLLALFFTLVSIIFQVNFQLAFGNGGVVIYWMSTYMVMLALGGANENVMALIFAYCPQYLMVWLMTWIIINISPSFYPQVLDNRFYRYGYAMPIHNALDLSKVIFSNLARHKMGRNYSILFCWIALNTFCLPLVLWILYRKMISMLLK
ncbi:hypothetical protein TBLA_0H02410 [Henningerozyma blattae CBS 6284]|uniref:DUF3533 domain-containing protein n=1 Tax=Henningerozyma blattae (strain ATCC 34711 / CBS 6284 / DSM 70876 / NBRC 10599 / NRRL Y-10934 / UCD 77-7) TaxID=1071380 RepID=I2H823_HENB6|nr:hypothetical protein TBLA_0H02410 [Tetrapisispora blattae CBS 6284]CCH62525.1 hypothetical protein TBLA_0H02410 [Tetrapisispora blattae CBS 6284]